MVIVGIDLMRKLPFLNATREYIQKENEDPIDIFLSNSMFGESIKGIIDDAFNFKSYSKYLKSGNHESIYIYPLLRIFLNVVNNADLNKIVGRLVSKTFTNILDDEKRETISLICLDQQIPHVLIQKTHDKILHEFSMHFTDFLHYSTRLSRTDPTWKLVNQRIANGHVSITKRKMIEIIKLVIAKKIEGITSLKLPKEFEEDLKNNYQISMFLESLQAIIEDNTHKLNKRIDYKNTKPESNAIPPCIMKIINELKSGRSVSNNHRLIVVYFLGSIGFPVKNIVDIFSNSAEFNRKKTEFQVNYAVNVKAYSPFSCVKMVSLKACNKKIKSNLCKVEKSKIVNPIVYYSMIYELNSKNEKNEKN